MPQAQAAEPPSPPPSAAGVAPAPKPRQIEPLPALGAGAGGDAGRDLRAGCLDPQEPAPAKAGVEAIAESKAGRCRRLVRALADETHDSGMEADRNLDRDDLPEHEKLALRRAA